MKRRITALCLSFIVLLSLTACGKNQTVMSVSDQQITEGVFSYYLDKVMSTPAKYGVKEETRENLIAAAQLECQKHAASINFMNDKGILLSTQRKQSVASQVESLWNLYSVYYKKIGVSKPDLTKVVTGEYRVREILDYYFGAEGTKPVTEDKLKEEFVKLYVGFKAVEGDLTRFSDSGETVSLTDSEKNELKKKFNSYAADINNGDKTIDEVNISYNDSIDLIVTESLETLLIKKGDPMFSGDFFEKVSKISHGKAAVIESGTSLYLVERQTIADDEQEIFGQYRSLVLEEMKMPTIEKKIKNLANEAETEVKQRKLKKIYEKVENVRSQRVKTTGEG